MANESFNHPIKKRFLTKNLFSLPEDILQVVNKYEPIVLPIFLMFKKIRIDTYLKYMKENEYKYEKLTNLINKFNNNIFDDLMFHSDLDEAFFNYLTIIKNSLKLPTNIECHIKNNKKNIKIAENISKRQMKNIQNSCLHKNTREYKRFIYDECVENIHYCKFCNFEVMELNDI
jgi:hypothetical protein